MAETRGLRSQTGHEDDPGNGVDPGVDGAPGLVVDVVVVDVVVVDVVVEGGTVVVVVGTVVVVGAVVVVGTVVVVGWGVVANGTDVVGAPFAGLGTRCTSANVIAAAKATTTTASTATAQGVAPERRFGRAVVQDAGPPGAMEAVAGFGATIGSIVVVRSCWAWVRCTIWFRPEDSTSAANAPGP